MYHKYTSISYRTITTSLKHSYQSLIISFWYHTFISHIIIMLDKFHKYTRLKLCSSIDSLLIADATATSTNAWRRVRASMTVSVWICRVIIGASARTSLPAIYARAFDSSLVRTNHVRTALLVWTHRIRRRTTTLPVIACSVTTAQPAILPTAFAGNAKTAEDAIFCIR